MAAVASSYPPRDAPKYSPEFRRRLADLARYIAPDSVDTKGQLSEMEEQMVIEYAVDAMLSSFRKAQNVCSMLRVFKSRQTSGRSFAGPPTPRLQLDPVEVQSPATESAVPLLLLPRTAETPTGGGEAMALSAAATRRLADLPTTPAEVAPVRSLKRLSNSGSREAAPSKQTKVDPTVEPDDDDDVSNGPRTSTPNMAPSPEHLEPPQRPQSRTPVVLRETAVQLLESSAISTPHQHLAPRVGAERRSTRGPPRFETPPYSTVHTSGGNVCSRTRQSAGHGSTAHVARDVVMQRANPPHIQKELESTKGNQFAGDENVTEKQQLQSKGWIINSGGQLCRSNWRIDYSKFYDLDAVSFAALIGVPITMVTRALGENREKPQRVLLHLLLIALDDGALDAALIGATFHEAQVANKPFYLAPGFITALLAFVCSQTDNMSQSEGDEVIKKFFQKATRGILPNMSFSYIE